MELLQLRYFFETAKSQNIAKTAETHIVPASSVSASIKRLEEELGCKLFDRHSNKIYLNENGKRLQRSLCVVFDELNQAVKDLTTQVSNTQEIKLFVRALRSTVTEQIVAFHKLHPETIFKTNYNLQEKNFDDFDLIIDEFCPDYSDYLKFELLSKKLYIHASNDNPFKDKPIRFIDLCHQPFITMGEHSNLHKILLRVCKNAGFTPKIVLETNDGGCYSQSIKGGLGLGLSRTLVNNDSVCSLNVIDFDERQIVYAFYKKEKLSPILNEFINFIKEN